MAGIKALRKIQGGLETTAGTETDATFIWRGTGAIEDTREVVYVEEDIGYLSGVDRSYIAKYGGSLSMDDTPATFEQFGYILNAGISTVASGTADTGGSGQIFTHTFPTTAAPSTSFYTLEGGDNQQAEQMLYSYVESFSLSGKGGEAVMMSADWKGRQVAPATFTGAVTLDDVEEVLFSKGKCYIDAIGGTIGSTQITSTLLEFSFSYATGIISKFTADGSLDFSFVQYTQPEATLELTMEHNATAVTEVANWRANTSRLIRLDFEGTSLTTAGSSHSVKLLRIDMAGSFESVSPLDDSDGNSIRTYTFRGRYNTTAGTFGSITVVNENASLP